MPPKEYVLATGIDGASRLELQHCVFAPGTEAFFDRLELPTKSKILVIGCGTGLETELMAKKVSPSTSILAIDSSEEQIEIATKRAEQLGIKNIRYMVCSVYELHLHFKENFDLVYCRFLLMNLQKPKDALNQMIFVTKINGTIACEEGRVSSCFTMPEHESFKKLISLILALGKKNEIDFDIGPKLFQYFHEMKVLCDISTSFYQPAVTEKPFKALSAMAAREMKKSFLSNELVKNEIEVDILASTLDREITEDPLLVHGQCLVTQISARKFATLSFT